MIDYLKPEEIYSNMSNGNLSKKDAMDLIITLIENNDYHMIRIEALEVLEQIGLKNKKLFKILENFVVSDEMQLVRAIALRMLSQFFPKKSIDALNWICQSDKSPIDHNSHISFAIMYDLLGWSDKAPLKGIKNELSSKLKPYVQNYINEGVVSEEAILLALLEVQHGTIKLNLVESNKFRHLGQDELLHYKINEIGNVTGIYIGKNIYFIPQHIYLLQHLEEFQLSGNFVTIIPESITQIRSLKILDLGWNYIKLIPDSIGSLLSLNELKLNNNKIQVIPNTIGLLKSLEIINLGDNKIKCIPDSLGLVKKLTSLDLHKNNIEKIPESISKLSSLKKLDLWHNKIESIPDSIENLKSLEILNLGHNKIEIIPESIKSFTSIKNLDLRFNNIKEIPYSLSSSSVWLDKLILEGNNIKNISNIRE